MNLDELKIFFIHGGIFPYLALLLTCGAFVLGVMSLVVRRRPLATIAVVNVLLVGAVGGISYLVAMSKMRRALEFADPEQRDLILSIGTAESFVQLKYPLILAAIAAVPVVVALALGPKNAPSEPPA